VTTQEDSNQLPYHRLLIDPPATAGGTDLFQVQHWTLEATSMRSPFQTSFAAVFQYELILNSKRIAPYALMVAFAGNAILWWGWSAAANFGWATNSDFNIARNFQGFSFILGLPLFNALIMGEPVIRDFNTRIDSLIFSKPLSRVSYLLGKFFANFFVFVCCIAAFMLMSLALQWIPNSQLVVFPARVFIYFKHFFLIVVISHMFLAAIFFTLATLKRNAKFAYGAAVAFYPIYFAYQLLILKKLPADWRVALDPMLLSSFQIPRDKWVDADWINQIVITYSSAMIANRVLIVAVVAICLAVLYFRFVIVEPDRHHKQLSTLDLSRLDSAERFHVTPEILPSTGFQPAAVELRERVSIPLPDVTVENKGAKANVRKLLAATVLELTLLRHERSLFVLLVLSILISFLSLPWSVGVSGESYSAVFAGSTARGLLLFLLGVIVFCIGEVMHRDREARVEPLVWSAPVYNNALLLSRFIAVLFVSVLLLIVAGLTAMLTQFLRGQTPIHVSSYLVTYTVILVPSLIFMAAASIALNVLVRDKYLTYAMTIVIGAALFYMYSQGFNHWLYNPVLYGLWTEANLTSWTSLSHLMSIRVYWLAIAAACLALAHARFARKTRGRNLY
jgi:ABC-type transport system involved in multi-copper enzyme maturation permease subunit